jgi:branched-chain amino acid aminotransferase
MRIPPTLLAMLATPSTAFMTPSPLQKKLYAPLQQNGVKQSSLFMSTTENAVGVPGTANLPWSELGFEFRPTKSHLRMVYKDGKWGEEELVEVRNSIKLSIHY